MARLNVISHDCGTLVEYNSTSGTISASTTHAKHGTYSLRSNPTTTGTGSAQVGTHNNTGTLAALGNSRINVRFYFLYDTKPAASSEQICFVRNSGSAANASVRLDSAGKLSVYDKDNALVATGTTVLSSGTWYCIELRCDVGTSAIYTLKIDDVTELSGTCNTTTTNIAAVFLGKHLNQNGQTVDFYYDSVAVDSAAFIGITNVSTLLATGNGTYTAWASDYTAVDEVPANGDTDFITSTLTTGDAETVNLTDCSVDGIKNQIFAVKPLTICRRDGASNGTMNLRVRQGGTDTDNGADFTSTSAYTACGRIRTANPTTSGPWTVAALDSLEVGVVERSAANKSRCTWIGAVVEWVALPARGPMFRRFI